MIEEHIKVLMVEDNPTDVKLMEYQLIKVVKNLTIKSVDLLGDFKLQLDTFAPDLILSDYRLKGFSGMDVLKHTREYSPDTTFVFVTGVLDNEELAADTILSGASGYILKKNINKLHEKLLPHLRRVMKDKKRPLLSSEHREALEAIQSFIAEAKKGKDAHLESCEQIRKTLENIKSTKDKM